jgi:hypothetical protein
VFDPGFVHTPPVELQGRIYESAVVDRTNPVDSLRRTSVRRKSVIRSVVGQIGRSDHAYAPTALSLVADKGGAQEAYGGRGTGPQHTDGGTAVEFGNKRQLHLRRIVWFIVRRRVEEFENCVHKVIVSRNASARGIVEPERQIVDVIALMQMPAYEDNHIARGKICDRFGGHETGETPAGVRHNTGAAPGLSGQGLQRGYKTPYFFRILRIPSWRKSSCVNIGTHYLYCATPGRKKPAEIDSLFLQFPYNRLMKKVVLQIYVLLAFLAMFSAACYVIYDISVTRNERFSEAEPAAAGIAALLERGRTLQAQDLGPVVQIDLVIDGETHSVYTSAGMRPLSLALLSGEYRYPLPRAGTEAFMLVRLQLLDAGDLIPGLRLLLGMLTCILILTGLLLALLPWQPERPPRARAAGIGPQKFVEPDSGLVPREQLEPRLQSELKRAASFDQDLSLAILSFDYSSEARHPWSREIHRFFIFRDLAFQYGPDRACIILPNIELEEAIRSLRDFSRHMAGALPAARISAGLSARSGRLLDSATMLKEAEAALAKSLQDDQQAIFGFRADPAKYRALLAEG